MEEPEVLELYEVHYSDLLLLCSTISSSSSLEEAERLRLISRGVMEALGPEGPGLLSITGVPEASTLQRHLLPLARRLALLNPDDRKRILKEHNLGSDVPLKDPDRSVSAFAMQLRHAQGLESVLSKPRQAVDSVLNSEQDHLEVEKIKEIQDKQFRNLGDAFRKLGFSMMDLGLRIAQICDRAIGGQELEQSLLESCAAKGRLIHYHSALDNIILKEAGRSKTTAKRQAKTAGKRQAKGARDDKNFVRYRQGLSEGPNLDINGNGVGSNGFHSNLWQHWHYDYGIFTVLTAPIFLAPTFPQATEPKDLFSVTSDEECPSPSGHTYLQIFNPNKNNVCMVKASPKSFIIQVGESADIISKGKLRSTLHSVSRPSQFGDLSRETFVVFLQPAWNKIFSISDYPTKHSVSCDKCLRVSNGETNLAEQERRKLTEEIQRIIPPLSSRLKDGITFAEFSRETTKQYYGGSGVQSNR